MSHLEEFLPAVTPVPALGADEIHVWSVDLYPPDVEVERLRRLLTPDELERASRFHFDRHRRRFVVRRGRLRQLLGSYAGVPPAAVRFVFGARGKPALAEEQNPPAPGGRLDFNLSDSEELAVYAFGRGLELGIDVEILRPMPDALSISESFFSAEEREVLRGVDEARRAEAFFNCWTRKEAYVKAIGEGLSEPLDRFCSTLAPGEEARFLHIGGSAEEAAAWSLFHFLPEEGAIGALAFRGHGYALRGFRWVVPGS